MAIVISIICIVVYCIYDRQRNKDKENMKRVNDRIDDLESRVNIISDKITETEEEDSINRDNPDFSGQVFNP